jgi:hypothetical protein
MWFHDISWVAYRLGLQVEWWKCDVSWVIGCWGYHGNIWAIEDKLWKCVFVVQIKLTFAYGLRVRSYTKLLNIKGFDRKANTKMNY